MQENSSVATRRLWLVATVSLALLAYVASSAFADPPKLVINGRILTQVQPPPLLKDSEVMWALRPLLNELGGQLAMNGNWIEIQCGPNVARVRADDHDWMTGNGPQVFSVAPFERNGSLYVSLRDIIRGLGGDYAWDRSRNTAIIEIGGQTNLASPGISSPILGTYLADFESQPRWNSTRNQTWNSFRSQNWSWSRPQNWNAFRPQLWNSFRSQNWNWSRPQNWDWNQNQNWNWDQDQNWNWDNQNWNWDDGSGGGWPPFGPFPPGPRFPQYPPRGWDGVNPQPAPGMWWWQGDTDPSDPADPPGVGRADPPRNRGRNLDRGRRGWGGGGLRVQPQFRIYPYRFSTPYPYNYPYILPYGYPYPYPYDWPYSLPLGRGWNGGIWFGLPLFDDTGLGDMNPPVPGMDNGGPGEEAPYFETPEGNEYYGPGDQIPAEPDITGPPDQQNTNPENMNPGEEQSGEGQQPGLQDPADPRLIITNPPDKSSLRGHDIHVNGYARSSAQLLVQVFSVDTGRRLVSQRLTTGKDGYWNMDISLNRKDVPAVGSYRVLVRQYNRAGKVIGEEQAVVKLDQRERGK